MFSIQGHWVWCIREWIQCTLAFSSHTDWCLTVILTLRTWAVWNKNQHLTIILPILYTLCFGSCLVILVIFGDSMTCKWNFHAHSWWMVYCMVVGAPPYPGFKGCFITYASQNIMFIWVLLLAWDARKCKYIVKCPSSDWRGSIVNAHVGTCHPSVWEILVLKISLAQLMFSNLDQDGGNTSLMTVVYRDGKPVLFCW